MHNQLELVMAHVQHMREGNCCDNLESEHLFPRHTLRILGSIQLVIDENFGGDVNLFFIKMLEVIARSSCRGEEPLIGIERWLNDELIQSGKLYH